MGRLVGWDHNLVGQESIGRKVRPGGPATDVASEFVASHHKRNPPGPTLATAWIDKRRKEGVMRNGTTTGGPITLADILKRLGDVAPSRIRWNPRPGEATEKDLIEINGREDRLYELIDGILVEKVMAYPEASLATWLSFLLQSFLEKHDLGLLAGADATLRLWPGMVRLPDVSFVSWEKLPTRTIPQEPIPDLVPDLAVEVLSKSNKKAEMDLKLRHYFLSGVRLVWYIDPRKRQVRVYTAPDQLVLFDEDGTLDGGDVLPGLALPVRQIFKRLPPKEEQPKGKAAKRRKGNNGR
jgi:Uma2 family endonuclease